MSDKSYRKELITCLGMPIDENPTVIAMDAAFKQLGLDYIYNGALVAPENLSHAIKGLKALNILGSNVTVPHKISVMAHLDEIDPDAALIGAVNTIYRKDGKLCGANTDGKGFVRSMNQANLVIEGKHFVILGTGGAGKAVAVELALAKAGTITLVNRTLSKAQALAAVIEANTATQCTAVEWRGPYVVAPEADFLINCTDIGLYPDANIPNIDYDCLQEHLVVCDVIPNPPKTQFLKMGEKKGCQIFDGLSMLVNQGIIALHLWTGLEADVEPMKNALQLEFQED